MKIIKFILVILAINISLFADQIIESATLSSGITELTFSLPDYSVNSSAIQGVPCADIKALHASYLREKGKPRLPFYAKSIIIPHDAAMEMEIVDLRYREKPIERITPSKGPLKRNVIPSTIPFKFGHIYQKDQWYPLSPVKLSKPFIMRDFRGITVHFYPFQYNPKKKIIKIISNITIRIKQRGVGTINRLSSIPQASAAFLSLYKTRFANYSQNESLYPAVADGDKMIIISPAKFLTPIKELLVWKSQKGIHTTAFEYPTETGGAGAEAIKAFIQNQYTTHKITYVLLVGNTTDLPSILMDGTISFVPKKGMSDPQFALCAGSDSYPDLFVGRLPADSLRHVEVMVKKIITYETKPDIAGTWYNRACGIASAESAGGPSDKEWMETFRTDLMAYNYSLVDQIYAPSASKDSVTLVVNQGRSWINYMGHGLINSWVTSNFTNSDVVALANPNILPVVISVACANGHFNGPDPCFAAAWMQHGSITQGMGSIVFLGASLDIDWVPPQHAAKEMIGHLVNDRYLSVGGIIYNGEMKMLENGNGEESYNMWNLFGDPSLLVYSDTPTVMSVTAPDNLDTLSTSMGVNFREKIDGRICLYSDKQGIISSQIIIDTNATMLTYDVSQEREILLTITARNRIPFQKTISVGPIAINNFSKKAPLSFNVRPLSHRGILVTGTPYKEGRLSMALYSVKGQLLKKKSVSGFTGVYAFTWNEHNTLPSGIYIVQFSYLGNTFSKSFMLP